ncbi:MAG: DNRLRE domain-containing protein, partial [Verrucomicrobiales bacterium]|nr:DNRLRE domain-containing protein [Verrucomicrobiales bacterium]
QQGVDHGFGRYNSNRHVRIMSVHGNSNSNERDGRVAADGDLKGGSVLQSLFIFDDIFGDGPGKIPRGSRIKSATLRFKVTNQGDAPVLFQMATAWDAGQLTFEGAKLNGNTSPGIQADDTEAFVSPATQMPHGLLGIVEVDVSEHLQKWVDGRENFGWVLRAAGSNAWGAEGIDVESKADRPLLNVEYEPLSQGRKPRKTQRF